MRMTIDKTIKKFFEYYNRAINNKEINKPISWALYRTWKWADIEETPRNEPQTGHWIIKDGRGQGYDIGGVKTWYVQIMCSECGFIKTAIEGHTRQYHYCPNCGIRMTKLQKSEK